MSEVNTTDIAEDMREVFQKLKDDGWYLVGSITAIRTDPDTQEETRIEVTPDIINTPDYETQISEPSDEPTAHLSGAGPTAGVPEEALPDNDEEPSAEEFDEDNYTSHSAQVKAEEAGLEPEDIEGRNDDGKIRVSDVDEQIAKDKE